MKNSALASLICLLGLMMTNSITAGELGCHETVSPVSTTMIAHQSICFTIEPSSPILLGRGMKVYAINFDFGIPFEPLENYTKFIKISSEPEFVILSVL